MTDEPRVLIVDDEVDLAELYATWLEATYETTVVHTGAGALESLDRDVDVILLNRRLSDMSGVDVLDAIGELDLGAKVAMLTALPPELDVIGMGFDTYLMKPVSKPELRAAVGDLLAIGDFDDPLQELYALVEMRDALDAENSDAKLDASEEYAGLEARISTIRSEIDASLDCDGFEPGPVAELSRNPIGTD